MLAINRFAYGPLIFVNGQANVQIGKLICYGTKPFLASFTYLCDAIWSFSTGYQAMINLKTDSPKRVVTIVHFTTISGHFIGQPL